LSSENLSEMQPAFRHITKIEINSDMIFLTYLICQRDYTMSLLDFQSQVKHLLPILKALKMHLWVYNAELGTCVLISMEIKQFDLVYPTFGHLKWRMEDVLRDI